MEGKDGMVAIGTHPDLHAAYIWFNDCNFHVGEFPLIASIVFSLILLMTTFLLGAIAVRVMGETGIEPVSGTSFIVLLMLFTCS